MTCLGFEISRRLGMSDRPGYLQDMKKQHLKGIVTILPLAQE